MNAGHWILLSLLWSTAIAASGPMPAVSLAEVVEAHGGEDALRAIKSYAARLEVTERWVRQSPTPEPPWATSSGTHCQSLDLVGRRYAEYERRVAPGAYPVHSTRWLTGDLDPSKTRAWHFNIHDGWREALPVGALRDRFERARRLAPVLLVRAMAAEPGRVTEVGTQASPEGPRSIFGFEPLDGPDMRLSFDTRTRMLRDLHVGEATVHYDGYEIVDGLPVSRRMALEQEGETVRRMHLGQAVFDRDFPMVPADLRDLPVTRSEGAGAARRFRTRTLAPGIHLIGEADRYQLFVEFRDFVVALGSVAGVRKRLRALRAVAGAKPLRYGLITHHHAEHLAGVPGLVETDAVLVVSPAHESAVREAAGPGRAPRFAHVTKRREITDGDRTLVFLELGPTRHSEYLLAAWLPGEKLLFTADLFGPSPGRPTPASSPPIRDLYRSLERLELDATRFVDPHTPAVANLADLKLAARESGHMSESREAAGAVCPR